MLEYTYANHLAKLLADKEGMAILSVEIGTRREELRKAVNDPLGYGWQGRIAINGDAERQINFYEGFVAFCVSLPNTLCPNCTPSCHDRYRKSSDI